MTAQMQRTIDGAGTHVVAGAVVVPERAGPFDVGRLDVGDGHVLAYRQFGNPDGLPIVYLHGGPGSGAGDTVLAEIDPTLHRAVLFDQRGAGASTPNAADPEFDWGSVDLDHHLADVERLRDLVGVERWAVHGYSWGSVLGVAYAERFPERVTAVVVGAVGTGTREDIDWLTVGVGRMFPREWEAFRDHVPSRPARLRLVEAYGELVMDPDPAVHQPAADAWCRWEDAHVAVTPGATPNPRYDDARFRLAFARQVIHCWQHDSWLEPDELVANAGRLAGIPGWLVHGRLDVSSPLSGPWRLHRAWPGSELIVVDTGHGGDEMYSTCSRLLRDLADSGNS